MAGQDAIEDLEERGLSVIGKSICYIVVIVLLV